MLDMLWSGRLIFYTTGARASGRSTGKNQYW